MYKDEENSTGELKALNTPTPDNTNGQAIYMYTPVTTIVDAPVNEPARWLVVFGNCPCRVDGMGNNDSRNDSKMVNGLKAAARWLFVSLTTATCA